MKLFGRVLIGSIAIVGASLFVPTFPEHPGRSIENAVTIKIDDTGKRLLVRTRQHDYRFDLPANHLNDSCMLSATDKLPTCLVTQGQTNFKEIMLKPSGEATTSFEIVFGGYDSSLPGFHGILSKEDKDRLGKLGFAPSNEGFSDVVNPPLYMTWKADLSGQHYPANSREPYDGANLRGPPNIAVVVDDPDTLRRNRSINSALRPFTAIRDGLGSLLLIAALLVTGANPFPSG